MRPSTEGILLRTTDDTDSKDNNDSSGNCLSKTAEITSSMLTFLRYVLYTPSED